VKVHAKQSEKEATSVLTTRGEGTLVAIFFAAAEHQAPLAFF
jgi:hypothetical protein